MRLVIDCYKLVKGAGKSIGIYNLAKSLVQNLALSEESISGKDEIVVLGNSFNRKDFDVEGIHFVQVRGNPLNKINIIFWELFEVVYWGKKMRADRLLFPRGYRPLFCPVPDAIIVHDLIPFYYHKVFPDTLNKLENAYVMNRLKASIRKAKCVITISEFSRKEIDRICPGCSDRVKVIYNGYNDVTYKNRIKFEKPYIFATTSEMPHKNADGILQAYQAYRRIDPNPLELVIVGIAGVDPYHIEEETARHIKCYKYIREFEEMCGILHDAKAFLFLSLMEGFGFPPLEAMQLGVPVVCSNRSSLPEVAADAALLVDPQIPEEAAQALYQVVNDHMLRENLIKKGRENISRFSWESRTKLYWKALKEF